MQSSESPWVVFFIKVSVCPREWVKVLWRPAEGVRIPGTEPPDVGAGNEKLQFAARKVCGS